MKLELLDFKELDKFPSGSGLEFYDNQLYIVGDDAKTILVTNKKWKKRDSIVLFEHEEARIPKKQKADLEATTLIDWNNEPHLLIIGSGSKEKRNSALTLSLSNKTITHYNIADFYNRLPGAGIAEVNIEGAAAVNDYLVLANRGNKTNPDNHLLVTNTSFLTNPDTAPLQLYKIALPEDNGPMGISGITYSAYQEQLLFTTSTEDTANAYDDGTIGKSYLGIVNNAYRKIGREKRIKANELIDLSDVDKQFKGFKIESVAIQSERNNSMKLHFVADNDTGNTYLFKVLLKF
jgi:hypothetical protein